VLFLLKKYKEALAEHDKAIALDPGDPDYHYSKGLELLKLENYQDALDAFDMAIVRGGNEIIYQYGREMSLAGLEMKDMR